MVRYMKYYDLILMSEFIEDLQRKLNLLKATLESKEIKVNNKIKLMSLEQKEKHQEAN